MPAPSSQAGTRPVVPLHAPATPAARARAARATRLPGLDGLRAVAIAAVVVFHLDAAWLPGGYLGVDVFFVVSGFLITTLLLREHEATGRVDVVAFWTRRARRLLPALLVCVPASILLARLVETDLLVGIGRQSLGALTFSTNWLEIRAGSDYFAATAPQLFMNVWSLAVEEQFYLLWPWGLLFLLALPVSWRRRSAVVAGVGLTSAMLMALLFDPATSTRVYYGTDTHLTGLMFGAALALTRATRVTWLDSPLWRRWRSLVLVTSGAVLLTLFLALGEDAAFTFRGGILLASAVTTALLAGLLDRDSRYRRILDSPALGWVGRRSYGIYLWHWPVILIVGQDLPTAPGSSGYLGSRLWCVLVTVALADLSYRFVETPVRRYGFTGAGRRLRQRLDRLPRRGGRVVVAVGSALALTTAAVVATAPDQSSTAAMLRTNEAAAAGPTALAGPVPATPASGTEKEAAGPPATPRSSSASSSTPSSTASSATTRTTSASADYSMPSGKEISGFGDSIMVGSYHALTYYFPGIDLDARSNRRWSDGLREVRAAGSHVRRGVVLAYGTNAGVDERTVRAVLERLGRKRLVVLVNLHAPFSRIAADNATLARVAADYPNVTVADWDRAISAHPGQLQPDGIHPSITGAHIFARAVRRAFADLSESLTGSRVTLTDLPLP